MNKLGLKSQLDIANYYKQLQTNDIVFAYKGVISGDLFDSILSLAENKLAEIEHQFKLKRKIQVITVEILQNIFHHFNVMDSQTRDDYLNTIIFVLSKSDNGYHIVAGNFVPNDQVNFLKEKIDWVNSLSPNELRQKYREILEDGSFSSNGGAGLGIFDIARKSGQKLEYDFSISESDYSFFCLKVKVPV